MRVSVIPAQAGIQGFRPLQTSTTWTSPPYSSARARANSIASSSDSPGRAEVRKHFHSACVVPFVTKDCSEASKKHRVVRIACERFGEASLGLRDVFPLPRKLKCFANKLTAERDGVHAQFNVRGKGPAAGRPLDGRVRQHRHLHLQAYSRDSARATRPISSMGSGSLRGKDKLPLAPRYGVSSRMRPASCVTDG